MGGAEAAGAFDDAARLQAAFAAADVHPLLCAVAHKTGDFSLLADAFAPDQTQLLVPGRGLTDEQEAAARARAGAAYTAHAASGRPDHTLAPDEWRQVFGFLVDSSAVEHWEGFLTEELALEGTDPRHPTWQAADVGRDVPVRRDRCRCLRPGGGPPSAPGRHRGHRVREER